MNISPSSLSPLLLLAPYISSIGRSAYFLNISETSNFPNHSLVFTLSNLLISLEQNSTDLTPFHCHWDTSCPLFPHAFSYKNTSFLPSNSAHLASLSFFILLIWQIIVLALNLNLCLLCTCTWAVRRKIHHRTDEQVSFKFMTTEFSSSAWQSHSNSLVHHPSPFLDNYFIRSPLFRNPFFICRWKTFALYFAK